MIARRAAVASLVFGVALALLGGWIAARPRHQLDAYPTAVCSPPDPATGQVFHVDPVSGSLDGDGSAARPFRDLQGLIADGRLGENRRRVTLSGRLFAALTHQPVVIAAQARPGAIIGSGDTILLADGDYGDVDLSGLANANYLTIAAAPGARPRFATLQARGASHFIFRGITIFGDKPGPGTRHLVDTYEPGAFRADNLIFDQVEIAGATAIRASNPAAYGAIHLGGLRLAGDCLRVQASSFHDLADGISLVRGRDVVIADNTIRDFSIDGIQFSGRRIAVRGNRIFDHWRSTHPLHPDCIQVVSPGTQDFGPATIEHNICISRLGDVAARPAAWRAAATGGWQGITLFEGAWRDVVVRCNLVLPLNPAGITLYGPRRARIEHNVVAAMPRGERLSWIGVMPSVDGRQPEDTIVAGNRASGFLNAVQGMPEQRRAMIAYLRVNPADPRITDTLMQPITGVSLRNNTWLVLDPKADLKVPAAAGFAVETVRDITAPRDLADALARYPLPAQCRT